MRAKGWGGVREYIIVIMFTLFLLLFVFKRIFKTTCQINVFIFYACITVNNKYCFIDYCNYVHIFLNNYARLTNTVNWVRTCVRQKHLIIIISTLLLSVF